MFDKKEIKSVIIHLEEDELKQKYIDNPPNIKKMCSGFAEYSQKSKLEIVNLENYLNDFMRKMTVRKIREAKPQLEALKMLCIEADAPDIIDLNPPIIIEYEEVEHLHAFLKKEIYEADRIVAIWEKMILEDNNLMDNLTIKISELKATFWGADTNKDEQKTTESKAHETGFGGMKKGFL